MRASHRMSAYISETKFFSYGEAAAAHTHFCAAAINDKGFLCNQRAMVFQPLSTGIRIDCKKNQIAGADVSIGQLSDYLLMNIIEDVDGSAAACADREAAIEKMDRHDKTRKYYHDRYCRGKWGQIDTYDLCIDSTHFGTQGTADFLYEYVKKRIEK